MATVYLALPAGHKVSKGLLWSVMNASRKHKVIPRMLGGMFPCLGFNRLWCEALNHSRWGKLENWGHIYMAMCHDDIRAEDGWIDTSIDEMDRVGAEVLSTVVALKSEHGLTSTGLMGPDGATRRFTMTEIMGMPETFSIKETCRPNMILAINTGLWVARWTQPWVSHFPGFACEDAIRCNAGLYTPHCFSEDWRWSRWLAKQMVSVHVTRKIKTFHQGEIDFENDNAWGTWETDQEAGPLDGGHQEQVSEPG